MSRAKTSQRIRRAKNARTGDQILQRNIDAALHRAAFRVTSARIERAQQQILTVLQAHHNLAQALRTMAHNAAQVAQHIRRTWGAA